MCVGYAGENEVEKIEQTTTLEFKCYQPEQAILRTHVRFILSFLNFRN